jgi:hypothetical protein
VAKLKHLGRTVKKENYNQEKIKNGLKMGNASYQSVQNTCLLVSYIKHTNPYKSIENCNYFFVFYEHDI